VQFIYIICQCEKIFFFIMVVFVFLHSPICLQGRNHVFKVVGVQFLGLGYYYPSTEKNRQVYPVWCSRLHNHTLFIKKLCKKLGVRPNFGEVRTPDLPVVAPMCVCRLTNLLWACLSVCLSVCQSLVILCWRNCCSYLGHQLRRAFAVLVSRHCAYIVLLLLNFCYVICTVG